MTTVSRLSNDRVATVSGGLATLGPDGVALRAALEAKFTAWAADAGAVPMLFPQFMRVSDLNQLDYFQNFPQLAVLGCTLTDEAANVYSQAPGQERPDAIPAADQADADYAVPSAACYNVYLGMRGTTLQQSDVKVTTVATCARREERYDDLRRLLAFTMREIVCVGERDSVLEHLSSFKSSITSYLARLELPVELEVASDPFFDPSAGRALMAQLFPVKEEFVYNGSLAIGSLNFHRNFFGERCDIRLRDGSPAYTGCVAFGLERWVSALTTHFGVDVAELRERVLAA